MRPGLAFIKTKVPHSKQKRLKDMTHLDEKSFQYLEPDDFKPFLKHRPDRGGRFTVYEASNEYVGITTSEHLPTAVTCINRISIDSMIFF